MPSNVAFLIWTLSLCMILTMDNSKKWVLLFQSDILCKKYRNLVDHLLLHCEVTKALYDGFFWRVGQDWVMPIKIANLLACWNRFHNCSWEVVMWKMIHLCHMWWWERNEWCFNNLCLMIHLCLIWNLEFICVLFISLVYSIFTQWSFCSLIFVFFYGSIECIYMFFYCILL